MIGLVKDRYRTSKYANAGLPKIQGDMHSLFIVLADRFTEAAMTLRRAEQALARGDAGAAEEFGAASTGFARCASLMQSLPDAISSFVNEEIISIAGGEIKFGVATPFTLGGAPPESDTVTVTGKPWVTINTVVMPFSPAPRTSAQEIYAVAAGAYVAGDGFDITLYNNDATGALGNYDVYWLAFPDGPNA